MKKITTAAVIAGALLLTGCSSDARVARGNLDTAAEQFEIERRIVFINGITDQYLLEAVGKCSYDSEASQVVVICKTGPGENDYVKHSMLRSDNVTVVVEQLEAVPVDVYRHRIIIKPETLIPDLDVETSADFEGDGR